MPQFLDQLYYDLELRTDKFAQQVTEASTQLRAIEGQLGTALPNSASVAGAAIKDGMGVAAAGATAAGVAVTTTTKEVGVLEAVLTEAKAAFLEFGGASTAATTAAAAGATGLAGVLSGGLTIVVATAATALVSYFTQARAEIAETEAKVQQLLARARARLLGPTGDAEQALAQQDKDIKAKEAELAAQRRDQAGADAKNLQVVLELEQQLASLKKDRLLLENELGVAKGENARAEQAYELREAQQLGQILSAGRASTAQLERITYLREKYGNVASSVSSTDVKSTEEESRAIALLDALEDKRRAKKEKDAKDPERAAALRDANKQLDDYTKKVQETAEKNRATIAKLTQESKNGLAAIVGDRIAILEAQLAARTAELKAAHASDDELKEGTASLQAQRDAAVALHGALERISVPKSSQKELKDFTTGAQSGADETAKSVRSISSALAEVGQAMIAVLGLFGALDEKTQAIARGATSIGQGIGNITRGNAIQGGAQIAGGVADIVAGVVAGEGELARQAAQHHREALQRLEAIKKNTGDLVGLQLSGTSLVTLQNALQTAIHTAGQTASYKEQPFNVLAAFRGLEGTTGKSGQELADLAKSFGVTLSSSKQSLQDFLNAIKAADLKAFADSFAGGLDELNAEFALFPERFSTNAEKFAATVQLLNDPKSGAPALFGVFKGFDTSTAEGTAAASAAIQDLFLRLKAGTLTADELNGLSIEQFLEQLKSLKAQLESPALVTAAEKFSGAIDAIGVKAEFGLIDAKERLKESIAAFIAAFPELAKGIDVSSLDGFKSSIEGAIAGFASDGVITDAEKAQIEALRALLAAFQDATPAAEQFADAISVLQDGFDILGTGTVDRFTQLAGTLGDKFSALQGVTDGLDANTNEGQAAIKQRLQDLFRSISADGISAAEQPVVDAIKQLLSSLGAVADEQARAAEQAERDRVARRKAILDQAERQIAADDVTDPVLQLGIRLKAVVEAIPGLRDALGGLDVSTEEGRAKLDAFVQSLADNPEQLAAVAEQLHVPVDELIATLLGLESGSDEARSALQQLATAAQQLADNVRDALDTLAFQLDLKGITDPLEKLRATVAALGNVDPRIAAAFSGLDLSTTTGRASALKALQSLGASTSDQTLRQEITTILRALRDIPEAAIGGPVPAAAASSDLSKVDQALQQLSIAQIGTNPQFAHLLDLEARQVDLLGGILAALRGFGPIVPPALPSGFGTSATFARAAAPGAGGAGLTIHVPVNFYATVNVRNPEELASTVQTRLAKSLDAALGPTATAKRALLGKSELS